MKFSRLRTRRAKSHNANSLPELLSVSQVAKALKLNPYSVRRYINQDILKAVRIGGVWRIKKSDLVDLINGPAPVRSSAETGDAAPLLAAASQES
jgi:excisionase family DNA binding protein